MSPVFPLIGIVLVLGFLTGCAISGGPPTGILYSNIKGPVTVTNHTAQETGYNSLGESSSWSILGLVCWGDASIDKAKSNGSPNAKRVKVTHIDYELRTYLGVSKYTLRVFFDDPSKTKADPEQNRSPGQAQP